ncbi:MAG: hypothetical protein JWO42_4009 [Chloroflexi bacterium]|jgi:hypothetical protein|nr:hypothetical protein [Chloroflexota bacterium]
MTQMATSEPAETGTSNSLRDYARKRVDIATCLENLARINEETGQHARAERIREQRTAILEQRFTLLVLGEFKRGKSTLINQLLGEETLPVGAAPTTAVLTRVSYGDEPSARILMDDGSELSVPLERLSDEITLAQTDEAINERRHAGIARAEVILPAAILRDGVDIVDSPGLGEHATRTEVTHQALPAADAVVFVSDAGQLGSEDEGFIRSRLATEDINNVFFVINKWDRVFNESEDPEAEVAALRRRAWSLFVPEPKVGYNGQDLRAHRIYPLSSRPNLAPEEERAALQEQFTAFRTDLESFLVGEAGRIALERAVARARALAAETTAGLRARGPALAAGIEEFDRRVQAAEAELRKLEGPRQAIRDKIAARRQQVRDEVRTRATQGLPPIEAAIKDEFDSFEYRPRKQLTQRIVDGMQDSFRRQKIREELQEKVREIAVVKLEPWAADLNAYVEIQIKGLIEDVAVEGEHVEAAFREATRILSGLDQPIDTSGQDQDDLLKRGIAAGIGVLLFDPFLIMSGSMHGFKGLGRTMLYQLAAGMVGVAVGLPLLPILVASAAIATVQNNDELIGELKKGVEKEVLERLQAMRTTALGDLQTQVAEPIDAAGVAVEKAIEARIIDHRETVASLREQLSAARRDSDQERTHLEEAQAEVADIATRLESIGIGN